MATRGRKRSARNLPPHIDGDKLPNGAYWDNSGRGHWYTIHQDADGRQHRKKIAGPDVRLSDLHRLMEIEHGGLHDLKRRGVTKTPG